MIEKWKDTYTCHLGISLMICESIHNCALYWQHTFAFQYVYISLRVGGDQHLRVIALGTSTIIL